MFEEVVLPDGQSINCHYLSKSVGSHLGWLHSVRRQNQLRNNIQQKTMYEFHESHFIEVFAREIISSKTNYDVVIAAPSSHPYSERYKNGLIANKSVQDISDRISRAGIQSASTSSTFEELEGEYHYTPGGDEGNFSSILIIDDVFGKGNTVLHIIRLLQKSGVPVDANFTVAAPLLAVN